MPHVTGNALPRTATHDATPQQRAARLALRMARGWQPTTAEAAAWLGMSKQGAHRMLTLLCGPGIPLTRDDVTGRWCLMEYIY